MNTLTEEQLEILGDINDLKLRGRYERILMLPKQLREYFFSQEVTERLVFISKDKFALPFEERKKIAFIVGLTMIGERELKMFLPSLVNNVGLDEEKARAVAKDINEQIFQPVREELLQVHGISAENGEIKLNGSAANEEHETTSGAVQESQQPNASAEPPANLPTHQPQAAPPEPKKGKDELLEHLNGTAPAPQQEATTKESDQTHSQPTETHNIDNGAENHRKELLERLKKAEESGASASAPAAEPPAKPAPAQETGDKIAERQTLSKDNGPQGVTAAWNGKTIDLTKIPPRRELKKEEGEHKDQINGREIKLQKGSDGYWYEV